jgi:hypothetical protein
MIDGRRAVREELAVGERPGQQHLVRIRCELHHHARLHVVDDKAELRGHLAKLGHVVGGRTFAAALRRRVRVGFERLNAQRHCVRRDVLAEAGIRIRARRAAAAAPEPTEPAAACRIQHG